MATNKRSLATLAALLAAPFGGTMAFAQGNQAEAPQTPAPRQAPATGQGMAQGRGIMGQGGMMGQMDPAQMNRMMENCNKMMEGMNRAPGGSGTNPSAPAPNGRRG